MWRTHVFCGVASLWLLAPLPGALTHDTLGPLCVLAAFGSLLPDLDAGESKIKSLSLGGIRPFAPLAGLVHQTWGHRAFTHSPAALLLAALVALLLGFWLGALPAIALWLGYASHLAADACTRSGVPRYAHRPLPRLHLLPPALRITTGSLAEERLLPFLALAVLLLLLSRLPLPAAPAVLPADLPSVPLSVAATHRAQRLSP